LYFATAFNGITSFAQNIKDLRAAGCDIVDDVGICGDTVSGWAGRVSDFYTNAGVVAQVRDATAAGALYFPQPQIRQSDAGTSGTWEGDFVDGGPNVCA
jgi:hypothetical protein